MIRNRTEVILLRDGKLDGVIFKAGTVCAIVKIEGDQENGKSQKRIYRAYPVSWMYGWSLSRATFLLRRSEFVTVFEAIKPYVDKAPSIKI